MNEFRLGPAIYPVFRQKTSPIPMQEASRAKVSDNPKFAATRHPLMARALLAALALATPLQSLGQVQSAKPVNGVQAKASAIPSNNKYSQDLTYIQQVLQASPGDPKQAIDEASLDKTRSDLHAFLLETRNPQKPLSELLAALTLAPNKASEVISHDASRENFTSWQEYRETLQTLHEKAVQAEKTDPKTAAKAHEEVRHRLLEFALHKQVRWIANSNQRNEALKLYQTYYGDLNLPLETSLGILTTYDKAQQFFAVIPARPVAEWLLDAAPQLIMGKDGKLSDEKIKVGKLEISLWSVMEQSNNLFQFLAETHRTDVLESPAMRQKLKDTTKQWLQAIYAQHDALETGPLTDRFAKCFGALPAIAPLGVFQAPEETHDGSLQFNKAEVEPLLDYLGKLNPVHSIHSNMADTLQIIYGMQGNPHLAQTLLSQMQAKKEGSFFEKTLPSLVNAIEAVDAYEHRLPPGKRTHHAAELKDKTYQLLKPYILTKIDGSISRNGYDLYQRSMVGGALLANSPLNEYRPLLDWFNIHLPDAVKSFNNPNILDRDFTMLLESDVIRKYRETFSEEYGDRAVKAMITDNPIAAQSLRELFSQSLAALHRTGTDIVTTQQQSKARAVLSRFPQIGPTSPKLADALCTLTNARGELKRHCEERLSGPITENNMTLALYLQNITYEAARSGEPASIKAGINGFNQVIGKLQQRLADNPPIEEQETIVNGILALWTATVQTEKVPPKQDGTPSFTPTPKQPDIKAVANPAIGKALATYLQNLSNRQDIPFDTLQRFNNHITAMQYEIPDGVPQAYASMVDKRCHHVTPEEQCKLLLSMNLYPGSPQAANTILKIVMEDHPPDVIESAVRTALAQGLNCLITSTSEEKNRFIQEAQAGYLTQAEEDHSTLAPSLKLLVNLMHYRDLGRYGNQPNNPVRHLAETLKLPQLSRALPETAIPLRSIQTLQELRNFARALASAIHPPSAHLAQARAEAKARLQNNVIIASTVGHFAYNYLNDSETVPGIQNYSHFGNVMPDLYGFLGMQPDNYPIILQKQDKHNPIRPVKPAEVIDAMHTLQEGIGKRAILNLTRVLNQPMEWAWVNAASPVSSNHPVRLPELAEDILPVIMTLNHIEEKRGHQTANLSLTGPNSDTERYYNQLQRATELQQIFLNPVIKTNTFPIELYTELMTHSGINTQSLALMVVKPTAMKQIPKSMQDAGLDLSTAEKTKKALQELIRNFNMQKTEAEKVFSAMKINPEVMKRSLVEPGLFPTHASKENTGLFSTTFNPYTVYSSLNKFIDAYDTLERGSKNSITRIKALCKEYPDLGQAFFQLRPGHADYDPVTFITEYRNIHTSVQAEVNKRQTEDIMRLFEAMLHKNDNLPEQHSKKPAHVNSWTYCMPRLQAYFGKNTLDRLGYDNEFFLKCRTEERTNPKEIIAPRTFHPYFQNPSPPGAPGT